MLDIEAVERVLDKRHSRGASDQSLISWLESLKKGAWKNYPEAIEGLIEGIRQTPTGNMGIL